MAQVALTGTQEVVLTITQHTLLFVTSTELQGRCGSALWDRSRWITSITLAPVSVQQNPCELVQGAQPFADTGKCYSSLAIGRVTSEYKIQYKSVINIPHWRLRMPSNNRLDVSHLNKHITKVNNINIPKPCMVKYNFHGTKIKAGRCLYRLLFTQCFKLPNIYNIKEEIHFDAE